MLKLLRLPAVLAFAAILSACGAPPEGFEDLEPLGDFRLGHNITVVDNPTMGALSRKVSDEEWETAMEDAVARQFSGFSGDRYYHIAIKVQGYVVAQPGIPVIAAPKSTLGLSVNIWDDAAGGKLLEEAKQIIVLESLSAGNIVSSGITKSRDEQVRELAENAAGEILEWLRDNPQWFDGSPNDVTPIAEPASGA
ncbi:hypothetical protein [Qingshengfaniella alkalisoli]|uniref:DUF4410 domain-containing protein n=1 Tax=Qingshengfaniella alkalisoli TaxID=2599296 RepID=A0A5B8IS79_9RHOB|nr:hypothetical protein [Qingshengfaniella alkalisoli]QDY68283.1 hypothetical protein FPZ52_00705 [Qingshengfaniella alkalisoli]